MNLNSSKKKQIIIYIFFIILGFVTRYFLFEDRNSWHDEWHSIYVADPNISNKETLLRFYGDKGDDFLTEFYPPLYLFLLKLVFKFFGYIDDIGRYVSLFFGVLTIIFSINLFNIIGGRKNYIFVGLLVSFNLFLIWQSLEIRAHSMFVAISLLNIILFYKILYYKNILLKFFYFITSVFLLSLWPITGAIFFGKTIFILKNFFLNKEKNLKILFLFSLILISYILINFDYLVFNIAREYHYTSLYKSFFYNYHFRSFFGSIYLGGIFLLLFAYLFLKNIKEIIVNNKKEDLLILIILSSYFLTLSYTLFRASIMSPKYVMFIIPLIIIWISIKIPYEKNKILNIFLILVTIFFFTTNISNSPMDRPPTKKVLKNLENENIKLIVTSEKEVFNNYLRTKKIISYNKIKVLSSKDEIPKNTYKFWFLCLNNPRFAIGDKGLISNNLVPEKKCTEFKQNKDFKEIFPPINNVQDYYIRRFVKKTKN